MLHVIFTPEGIPGHISDDPREGSEPIEGLDLAFLLDHRRTAKGKWVARVPVVPPAPTAEELAAAAEAEREAALAARDEALRLALAREADPVFFKYQREEATRDDWLAAVAAVKAAFPKPGTV